MPANIQRPFSRGSFESSFTNLPRPTPVPKGPLKPARQPPARARPTGDWVPTPGPISQRPVLQQQPPLRPPSRTPPPRPKPRPMPPRQPRKGTVRWTTPAEQARERAVNMRNLRPRDPGAIRPRDPIKPRPFYGEKMPDGTVRVGHTPPKGRGRKRGQSGAGQIMHIDPETGRQGTPTAADLAKMRPGRRPTRRQPVVEKFDHPTFSRGMTDTEGLLRKRARRRGPSLAEVQGSQQAILRPGGTGSDLRGGPVTPAELARLRAEDARRPRQRIAPPPRATRASSPPQQPPPRRPRGPIEQAKMGPVRRGSTWDDTLRLGAPPSRWDPRSPNYVGPGPGGRRKGPIPRPKPPPRPRGPLTVIETRDRRDRPRPTPRPRGPIEQAKMGPRRPPGRRPGGDFPSTADLWNYRNNPDANFTDTEKAKMDAILGMLRRARTPGPRPRRRPVLQRS